MRPSTEKILFSALMLVVLLLFPSCSSNRAQDFITIKDIPTNGTRSARLGMSRDAIFVAWVDSVSSANSEISFGVKLKWPNNKDFTNCIAMINTGLAYQTAAGLSLNNTMSDVLSLYQKEPGVTVAADTPTKIVLQKQIDGTNYAMAVRGYDDGDIKSITIYNADLYNDDDANYQ